MKTTTAIAAIVIALACVAGPAAAKSKMKMMACDGNSLMKMNNMTGMMPDGQKKMMMQREIGMASTAMSKGDMRGCGMHMSNAHKASMMKDDGMMGGMKM